MRMRMLWIIAGVSMLVPAAAVAQTEDGGADQSVTEYEFLGDELTGTLVRPGGERYRGELHEGTESLIEVRRDFVPELLRSAEEL